MLDFTMPVAAVACASDMDARLPVVLMLVLRVSQRLKQPLRVRFLKLQRSKGRNRGKARHLPACYIMRLAGSSAKLEPPARLACSGSASPPARKVPMSASTSSGHNAQMLTPLGAMTRREQVQQKTLKL
jgi:hypothetical protein